jgi:hypothetical protein
LTRREQRVAIVGLPCAMSSGFNTRMPELTRRRSEDRQDCWHIYYGDVRAGTITMRVDNP